MTTSPAIHADSSMMLAVERTRLAHERTLIAWLRTALSMISFGFTIYKFFQYQVEKGLTPAADRLMGPREFALVMIGMGLLALVLSMFQHRQSMKRLRAESDTEIVPVSMATIVAALFSVFGILAFVSVLFRE